MSYGKIAFEAYNKDRGGVNHLGKKTPEWHELPEEIRHAWEAGACAVNEYAGMCFESIFFDVMRDYMPAGQLIKIVEDLCAHPPPFKYGLGPAKVLGKLARKLVASVMMIKRAGLGGEEADG